MEVVAPLSAGWLDWELLVEKLSQCVETDALLSGSSLQVKTAIVDGCAVQCDFFNRGNVASGAA